MSKRHKPVSISNQIKLKESVFMALEHYPEENRR